MPSNAPDPGTMTDETPEIPEETDGEEKEDNLWETQKYRIILAVILLGILIYLVVFVNVPLMRTTAGTALATTGWQLDQYADSTGILVPVRPGSAVTARFMKDGTVAGSAGCNTYSARYSVTELSISVTAPAVTEMYCMDPGVMEQEQAYLADLPASAAFRVTDSSLKVYGADGKTLLSFIPAP